ncbi:MAG TPA: YetF domain-containing protein [Terracidiphilus sp.]|nr:YetF domain-containing protein [Terracidiphilus sp.]
MGTVIYAIAGYFVLLLTVRSLKRRTGSSMTLFEFVFILLIGGMIILATVGRDRSVTNCTCAVIAVGFVHRLLSWAKSRSPRVGRLLDGTPLVIVKKGEWQQEAADALRLRIEDLEVAAREAGVRRVEDVEWAVLERGGRISVFGRKE